MRACEVSSVVSGSFWPLGLQPTRLPCPWDSPGKNTGVDSHCLLLGIFLIQCLSLLHWEAGSLPLAPPENLKSTTPKFKFLKKNVFKGKREKEKEGRVFDCVKCFWEVTYYEGKKKSIGWSSKISTSFGFNNIMENLKVPPYGFRCGRGGGGINQTGEG